MLAAGEDDTVYFWDTQTWKLRRSWTAGHGGVIGLDISSDGTLLATTGYDGTTRFWTMSDGQSVSRPLRSQSVGLSVAFSPDGTRIATAGVDNIISFWDVTTGQLLLRERGHNGNVTGVAFSSDGRFLASSSYDGTAKIWDVRSLTARWDEVLAQACINLLGTDGRYFTREEIDSSALLASEWRSEDRDVCGPAPRVVAADLMSAFGER